MAGSVLAIVPPFLTMPGITIVTHRSDTFA